MKEFSQSNFIIEKEKMFISYQPIYRDYMDHHLKKKRNFLGEKNGQSLLEECANHHQIILSIII